MDTQVRDFVRIADTGVVLEWWQGILCLAAFGLAAVGAGVVMILAGRTGMKAEDITPMWRTGYTLMFIFGWWFIAFGIGFPLITLVIALMG